MAIYTACLKMPVSSRVVPMKMATLRQNVHCQAILSEVESIRDEYISSKKNRFNLIRS